MDQAAVDALLSPHPLSLVQPTTDMGTGQLLYPPHALAANSSIYGMVEAMSAPSSPQESGFGLAPVGAHALTAGTSGRTSPAAMLSASGVGHASHHGVALNAVGGNGLTPRIKNDLYKTEICRSFAENGGYCKYGSKCQFAHGEAELRPVRRHPRYKTKLCRNFSATGSCPYDARCRFIHAPSDLVLSALGESDVMGLDKHGLGLSHGFVTGRDGVDGVGECSAVAAAQRYGAGVGGLFLSGNGMSFGGGSAADSGRFMFGDAFAGLDIGGAKGQSVDSDGNVNGVGNGNVDDGTPSGRGLASGSVEGANCEKIGMGSADWGKAMTNGAATSSGDMFVHLSRNLRVSPHGNLEDGTSAPAAVASTSGASSSGLSVSGAASSSNGMGSASRSRLPVFRNMLSGNE